MQINRIDQSNTTNFKAKYVHTDDLKKVVEWAIERDKLCKELNIGKSKRFAKLNQARKNIDCSYPRYRIGFNFGTTKDGKPFVSFTRYVPKDDVIDPKTTADYEVSEPIVFQSYVKQNPYRYAYKKLIQIGNGVPNSKIFQRVVIRGGD